MDKTEIDNCMRVYEREVQIAISGLVRRVRAIGRNVLLDDREDLTQEFRIVLYKCLVRYKPERGLLKTYIATTLDYAAKGVYRKYCNKQASFNGEIGSLNDLTLDDEEIELISMIPDGKTETVDDIDRKIYCGSLLDKLDGRDKIWIKSWLDGKTLDEIGESYGVTRQAVSQQIRRVLRGVKNEEDSDV